MKYTNTISGRMIINDFILEARKDLLPDYKISPFGTNALKINQKLPESDYCDFYFGQRFADRNYIYTLSGRQAINLALSCCHLDHEDYVTILTTSGNKYISSCVTTEIEKFCRWSRNFESRTKLIFVNHEFGYPFKDLSNLKEFNLPIIEDCAHSFFSEDFQGTIGRVGDFVIYSFPKIFPVQIGGLLVSLPVIEKGIETRMDLRLLQHIKKVVSFNLMSREEIIRKRRENYLIIRDKLKLLGFIEHFSLTDNIVPGIYLFKVKDPKIDLQKLKEYFFRNGVECSVFYGTNSFFLPCHQNLDETDFDYFISILVSFLNKGYEVQ